MLSLVGLTPPLLADLEVELETLKSSTQNGVPGVLIVDSGRPGPTLGITLCTHGKEPSGLAAASYLTKTFALGKKLLLGKVMFVLNNIRATEQYFSALRIGDIEAAKNARSSSEVNFNRLPANVMDLPDNGNYELSRARQLLPVWEQFDVGFDIHSTTLGSDPMIILCDGSEHSDLMYGFPVEIIIRNIQVVQINKPAASFYGQPGRVKTLAIEAGSHESAQSFVCAIRCCHALLQNLGMIEGNPETNTTGYKEYFIADSVVPRDDSFTLARTFSNFEHMKTGQVLATDRQGDVLAPFDGHVLFCKDTVKPGMGEEALFLSKPVRIQPAC